MIEKLYTVEEVAEMASVTGRTIRNYLKSGKLVGRKIGGQWRFPESEVQRLLTGESTEEYYPQNPSTNPSLTSAPQNFDTSTFPRVEQNYTPTMNPAQQNPTPFGGMSYSAAPAENIVEQNMGGFTGTPQQAPSPLQTYATGTFPAQKQYTQPSPQNDIQTSYNNTTTTNTTQSTPNFPQQSYSTQPSIVAPSYSSPSASSPTQNSYSGQPPYQPPTQPSQQFEQNSPHSISTTQNEFSQSAPYQYDPQIPIEPLYDYTPAETPSTQATNNYVAPVTTVPEISDLLNAYVEQVSNSTGSGNYQSAAATSAKETISTTQEDVSKAKKGLIEEDKDTVAFTDLSDVGKQVGKFLGEVHDCSNGPQICAVIDLYQSLEAAKITSQHITEMAEIESENGIPCDCFVEFDSRYYVARYTLFGSSYYLSQCLDLIG